MIRNDIGDAIEMKPYEGMYTAPDGLSIKPEPVFVKRSSV
jgi:hypothetical protein